MKKTDIINFVFHHREALQTKAPSKALVFVSGIAGGGKYILIDHSRSRQLQANRRLCRICNLFRRKLCSLCRIQNLVQ